MGDAAGCRLRPGSLQALSTVNPLSYEVDAPRSLILNVPGNLPLDAAVLVVALVAGVSTSAALLDRLAR